MRGMRRKQLQRCREAGPGISSYSLQVLTCIDSFRAERVNKLTSPSVHLSYHRKAYKSKGFQFKEDHKSES